MTSTTAQPAAPAQQRSRGLILFGAVSVALISTAAAYQAMVGFGLDVLAMGTITAFAFAGVFELSLVTVALMAREASQHGRPAGTLLTLTWIMSLASGFFAGWHEIHLGHPVAAAAFRFIVPLLAALMWHLALIGDRHLASGRTFAQLRADARLAVMFRATRIAERAYHRHQLANTTRTSRQLERAQARQDRAEDRVLDTVPPADVRAAVTEWRAAVVDVADATTDIRLHESRRLIALRAPRDLAHNTGTVHVEQLFPAAEAPTIAGELNGAEGDHEPAETEVERAQSAQASTRPHLVTVKVPAEGTSKATSTAATAPTQRARSARAATVRQRVAELREEDPELTNKDIAKRLAMSERTLYRFLGDRAN
ncbi:hypothetical protein [Nocardioides panzhihuensis]|uniref:Homeodomain-like domain-containing protein n=1 Tax=Nocardioides panzhihuensis TaxID=860243 RepID=A0A7Z0DTR4_9ACTN|nr:hypothetical protein [Nocardioides panzhihuensis]NYI81219.1 hypothetical protein [Nocardioides panzhihuensis]